MFLPVITVINGQCYNYVKWKNWGRGLSFTMKVQANYGVTIPKKWDNDVYGSKIVKRCTVPVHQAWVVRIRACVWNVFIRVMYANTYLIKFTSVVKFIACVVLILVGATESSAVAHSTSSIRGTRSERVHCLNALRTCKKLVLSSLPYFAHAR
jgi:hypothetical protein